MDLALHVLRETETDDMPLINIIVRIMSNDKPAQNNEALYMSSILACRILRAMQPTRSFLRWTDDLHKIFVEAVAYQGGPYEAKPTAVKQTMEAMGVTGLTTWNIKSHLQKYREGCDLGAKSPRDVLDTASPSEASHDPTSETEVAMNNDEAMTGMQMVNNLLMGDMEMAETDFSADEVQMMENELMNEIQLIKHGSQCSQIPIDEYVYDLAKYPFDKDSAGSASSSSL
ncbi:protein PHR1-LIKE 2-like isoform X1 [Brachypodium distachyon]|nr:protein PHR1-LIKE 2-like isoform X1 [Brachypodium distachyon]XP_010231927.1 protein PHR1-LIKE 2-like isoform X1 [Brachypodium distachyon]|eukprot:XP_010231922.1 protein PHR1-LIKE 2-like isoform X1 [Brachypodium distachyon]